MKTYEVSARVEVFVTLTICANSETEARQKTADRVCEGDFEVDQNTAMLDGIHSVNLIEEE